MPKLAPITFHHETATDEKLRFEAQVSVDSDGLFRIELPDDIFKHAKEFCDPLKHQAISVETQRIPRVGYRSCVISRSLAAARSFVEEVIRDFMKVETSEELVLAYCYECKMHYWQNADGSIWPHGCAGGAKQDDGCGWVNVRKHYRDDAEGGIAIGANVFRKLTHKRGATTTVQYVHWRPKHSNRAEEDDIKAWLNRLSPISIAAPTAHDEWTVIPYSDKAAHFFYNAILSLCKVDQQLRKFFEKPENVTAAIESGAALMLK